MTNEEPYQNILISMEEIVNAQRANLIAEHGLQQSRLGKETIVEFRISDLNEASQKFLVDIYNKEIEIAKAHVTKAPARETADHVPGDELPLTMKRKPNEYKDPELEPQHKQGNNSTQREEREDGEDEKLNKLGLPLEAQEKLKDVARLLKKGLGKERTNPPAVQAKKPQTKTTSRGR